MDSALEQLAQAVLDGRVRLEQSYYFGRGGIPVGSQTTIHVDPLPEQETPS